jgi:hypothetical protein
LFLMFFFFFFFLAIASLSLSIAAEGNRPAMSKPCWLADLASLQRLSWRKPPGHFPQSPQLL